MAEVRLTEVDWPDFGAPDVPAETGAAELGARLDAVRAAMAARGLDRLFVYGDREHAANIHWLTGFDPRFEEAFLVVGPEGPALLAAGNECLPYTAPSPLAACGRIVVAHCPALSLISQPRSPGLTMAAIIDAAVPAGARIGTAGWKYWEPGEVETPARSLEIPAVFADLLRQRAGDAARVVNATDLFMHPGHGLRARITVDEVPRLEFANHMAAAALRRMVFAFHEGMTDFAAVEAAAIGGLPLGCHPTFATGTRADQGLSSPSGQRLVRGRPISFNICHHGANICRAGWVAETARDLPEPARDYLAAFAGPYLQALSAWFGMMRPGVAGADVHARIMAMLPPDRFGITLNPGHLIGADEWISSPIGAGSGEVLASGMAMQCDIIPAHSIYGSVRMEDGYVIADETFRQELAARFPAVAARCARRAEFMRAVIGLDLPETLLPLADTCGVMPPYLLAPRMLPVLA